MNYYKRHIGDYARKTAHLDFLEDAAYMRLLDLYYSREAPIPDDEAERLTRSRTTAEKKAVRRMLAEFFELKDGVWIHDRCEREIAEDRVFIDQQRAKAAKRWANNGTAKAMPEHMPRHASGIDLAIPPTPTPNLNPKSPDPASPARPLDPRKALFDLGVSMMGEKKRSLIGKAISEIGESKVAEIIGAMAAKPPVDPGAYFAAATQPKVRGVQC